MRHVSREPTELLWIGCLTEFILILKFRFDTLIPKIKSQTFLTKNNLLHLFNISHFSSTCCAKNSSLVSCPKTMAKRMQEQKEEKKTCGKIEIYSDELVFTCSASSSSADSPIASKSPGILIATGKLWKQDEKKNQNPTQRRVLKRGCKMHTSAGWWTQQRGNLSQTKEESGNVDLSEPETWSLHEEEVTVRPVASETATGKPNASSKSDHPKVPKLKE